MKRYKEVFLVHACEQELMRNKRIFEMLDLAERVHTFSSAEEALYSLLQPGRVPDMLIAGSAMEDESIAGFMRRYENLPEWVTRQCKVYLLLPPLDELEAWDYHHRLLQKTLHQPFCAYELTEENNILIN
ncbi:MAG: hypothetical protein AB1458_15735 [Bacteroidota bacterium]